MITHDDSTERALGNEPEALAPLSRAEAAHLVRLSLEAAARHALPARYDGAGALVLHPDSPPSGRFEAGLTNLARIVAGQRPDHWPRLVGEHFDRLAHAVRHGPPPAPADPRRELLQRLAVKDSLEPRLTSSAPEFVPGLLSVPATTTDGTITMYLDPETDLGLSWAAAESYGLRNLRSLTDTVTYAEHDGTRVALVTGHDFAASRALVLDTVLRESLQIENPRYGVLAAMPVRNLLLVHVIADLSVIPALGLMLNLAGRSYATDPGPLSPWIYLAGRNGWQPATRPLGDSAPGLSSPFVDLLHQLDQAS
ncbi:hypothetical protein [Kribbella sp. CA-293567]|uniref:hypothetical protein n=1 Tax=Kribbella sp. CA-293567 TaxID=3002436 RepID=UPI0022DDD1C4|nr:hypothetical protein [Kribbella sp. CA-293567]WBQ04635.1 hypothetical protein OX958_32310 [Kribbella sp. CA-293567]